MSLFVETSSGSLSGLFRIVKEDPKIVQFFFMEASRLDLGQVGVEFSRFVRDALLESARGRAGSRCLPFRRRLSPSSAKPVECRAGRACRFLGTRGLRRSVRNERQTRRGRSMRIVSLGFLRFVWHRYIGQLLADVVLGEYVADDLRMVLGVGADLVPPVGGSRNRGLPG